MYHETMRASCFSFFIPACLTFPCVAGELAFPTLVLDGHTYGHAVLSYQGGLTAKISHDEGTRNVPITQLISEQQTALGITPETISRESAKEKARKEAEKEKLSRQQKQKEQFKQELARSEKYTVRVYGHTRDAVLAYSTERTPYGYSALKDHPFKIIGLKEPSILKKDTVVHFKAIRAGEDIVDYKSFPVLKFLQFTKKE